MNRILKIFLAYLIGLAAGSILVDINTLRGCTKYGQARIFWAEVIECNVKKGQQ